jgi:hypothetical protein
MGLDIMDLLKGGTSSAPAEYYPASQAVACQTWAPVDAIEQTVTAGQSSLSYDALTGQYTYVWKTDKTWATKCRQLVVQLKGTAPIAERKLTADFQFTK